MAGRCSRMKGGFVMPTLSLTLPSLGSSAIRASSSVGKSVAHVFVGSCFCTPETHGCDHVSPHWCHKKTLRAANYSHQIVEQAETQTGGREPEYKTGCKANLNRDVSNGAIAPLRKSFPAFLRDSDVDYSHQIFGDLFLMCQGRQQE
jgi:hypothetical protein